MKKKVAILGATGLVGRRLAELLIDHPWFEIGLLVGSGASTGERFETVWQTKEAALQDHYGKDVWRPRPFPKQLQDKYVHAFEDILASDMDFVFSSVPERAAAQEDALLEHGFTVFSNSPFGRCHQNNPLVVPEVNRHDMQGRQFIKSPNCVTAGLVLVLDAIKDTYGLEQVAVTTYQSLSGRGDAKYGRDLVVGNILSLHGSDERPEVYIRNEAKKILHVPVPMSVSCNRVYVQEGHYVDVRIKTTRPVHSDDEVREVLRGYNPLAGLDLPSCPSRPLAVLDECGRPRPRQDAWHADGMAVAVGNITTDDEVFDLKLSYVVNNVVRGAAGGALLTAEAFFAPPDEAVLELPSMAVPRREPITIST